MSTYYPDKWKVIEITQDDGEKILRVFGSWRTTWRLNSGIVGVEVEGDYIHFYGYSGSTYTVHKDQEGTYHGWELQQMISDSNGLAVVLHDYVKNNLHMFEGD